MISIKAWKPNNLFSLKYVAFLLACLWLATALANDADSLLQTLLAEKKLSAPASTKRFYDSPEAAIWEKKQLHELVNSIQASYEHGLLPEDYHLQALTTHTATPEQKGILATDAYLTLAGHLLGGKVNPLSIEPTWTAKGREKDLVVYLQQALKENKIQSSLNALAPAHPDYQLLLDTLAKYRDTASRGGWTTLPAGETLTLGMQSARVAALRARLEATGDITPVSKGRDIYDPKSGDREPLGIQLSQLN